MTIRSNLEEASLLQQLHLETEVSPAGRQALNLSPITAAISLASRLLHVPCFLLQAMAAGTACSGATTANAYSPFSCAIIVVTAMITATRCSRAVSIVHSSLLCLVDLGGEKMGR